MTLAGRREVEAVGETPQGAAHGDDEPPLLRLRREARPVDQVTSRAQEHRGIREPRGRLDRAPAGAVQADVQQQVGGTERAGAEAFERYRFGGIPEAVVRAGLAALVERVPVQVEALARRVDELVGVPVIDERRRGRKRRGPAPLAEQPHRTARVLGADEHVEVGHRPRAVVAVGERDERGAFEQEDLDAHGCESLDERRELAEADAVARPRLAVAVTQLVDARVAGAGRAEVPVELRQQALRGGAEARQVDVAAALPRCDGRARIEQGSAQQQPELGSGRLARGTVKQVRSRDGSLQGMGHVRQCTVAIVDS